MRMNRYRSSLFISVPSLVYTIERNRILLGDNTMETTEDGIEYEPITFEEFDRLLCSVERSEEVEDD